MAYDQETAERVRKLLSRRRDVVEKKLMGGLCFMVTGGMCCSVSGRGGLLVRVGAQMQEQMLREPHAQPMKMGGRTMRGFVRVAPDGYRTDAQLKTWLKRGVEAAASRSENSRTRSRTAKGKQTDKRKRRRK